MYILNDFFRWFLLGQSLRTTGLNQARPDESLSRVWVKPKINGKLVMQHNGMIKMCVFDSSL